MSIKSITRSTFARFSMLVCSLAILNGCSGASSGKSTVSFTLPNFSESIQKAKVAELKAQGGVSSMANVITTPKRFISRVMINVTGEGMAPQVIVWQPTKADLMRIHARTDGREIDRDFTVEIPRGSNRLFQLLVLVEDFAVADGQVVSDGGAKYLFYGDKVETVTKDSNVELSLSLASAALATAEGRIAGRYFETASDGPTGKINVLFNPPNGRAPMIVTRAEMHGGWFEVFGGFRGSSFSYQFADGKIIPEISNHKAGETDFSWGPRALSAKIPKAFRAQTEGSYTYISERSASFYSVGIFGPGALASGMSVCASMEPKSIGYLYTTSALTTPLTWSGSIANGVNEAGVLAGGNSCVGAEYTDYIRLVNSDSDAEFNSDRSLGFRGPFKQFTPSSQSYTTYFDARVNGSNIDLEWKYLPNTTGASRITSLEIFARTLTAEQAADEDSDEAYRDDDLYRCGELESKHGFSRKASVVSTQTTTSLTGIDTTAFSEGKIEIVACPSSAAGYFGSGLYFRQYGHGPGSSSATHLSAFAHNDSLVTASSPSPMGVGGCVPFVIRSTNAAGSPMHDGFSRQLQVIPGASVRVSESSDCSGGGTLGQTVNISNFWNEKTIYLSSMMSSGNSAVAINDVSGTPLQQGLISVTHAPMASATTVQTRGPSAIYAHSCYPVRYELNDASGQIGLPYNGATFSFPSVSDLSIFTQEGCSGTTAGSTFSLTNSQPTKTVWFVYKGGSSNINMHPAVSVLDLAGGGQGTAPAKSVAVTQPGVPSMMTFEIQGSGPAQTCIRANTMLMDSNHRTTPNPNSALTVNLSATSGNFYSDNTCETQTAVSSIANGAARSATFYFKASSPASVTLTASIPSTTIAATFNLGITMARANKLRLILPGEVWNVGAKMVDGVPTPQKGDHNITGQLVALTPDNDVDTAMTEDGGVTLTGGAIALIGSGTWIAGYKPVTVRYNYLSISQVVSSSVMVSGGSQNYQSTTSGAVRIQVPYVAQPYWGGIAAQQGACIPSMYTLRSEAVGATGSTSLLWEPSTGGLPSVTLGGSNVTYFSEPGCTASVSGPVTFDPGQSARIVYTRPLMLPGQALETQATISNVTSMPVLGFINTTVANSPSSGIQKIKVTGEGGSGRAVRKYSCEPVLVSLVDNNDASFRNPSGAPVTVTLTSEGVQKTFHTDGTCAGGSNSTVVSFGLGEVAKLVYVRYAAIESGGAIRATSSGLTDGVLGPIEVVSY